MPRCYHVNFENVTVAAAQDLVQITGATGKQIRIARAWVGHGTTSLATAQGLRLRSRFLPATVTIGAGGTTGITPSKKDQGDATCSTTTCATNNTTPATTSGTAVVLMADGCHLHAGYVWVPAGPIWIGPSQAFVWELLSTVSGTVTLSGGVDIEEIG